jgi:hypothetical protein
VPNSTTTSVNENDPVIFQLQQKIEFLQIENKSILQKVGNLETSTSITKGEVIKTTATVMRLEGSVKLMENNITTLATKNDVTNGFNNQKSEMDDMKYLLGELVKGIKAQKPTMQPPWPQQQIPPPPPRTPTGIHKATAAQKCRLHHHVLLHHHHRHWEFQKQHQYHLQSHHQISRL